MKSPMENWEFVGITDYLVITETRKTVKHLFSARHLGINKLYFKCRKERISALIKRYREVTAKTKGKQIHCITSAVRFGEE